MAHMLKINPELEYKSRTQFVEKAIEEKLDKIETELVLKSIKEEGIAGFKESARKMFERTEQLGKQVDETRKLLEQTKQATEEIKKKKHTLHVYKSKKK